jgi:hypothetical protein
MTDAECPGGQQCLVDASGAKKCTPTMCEIASECPSGFACAASTCQRLLCNGDAACPNGGACVNGACFSTTGTCK